MDNLGAVTSVRDRRAERRHAICCFHDAVPGTRSAGDHAWHEAELAGRAAGDHNRLAAAVRDQIELLNRNVPVTRVRELRSLVDDATLQPRFRTGILSGFAVLALLLSAIGVYGILAEFVEQRTKEIGIRMALGAASRHGFRSVLMVGMRTTLVGVGLGFSGTLVLGRVRCP